MYCVVAAPVRRHAILLQREWEYRFRHRDQQHRSHDQHETDAGNDAQDDFLEVFHVSPYLKSVFH